MNEITILTPAKINLSIDVTERLENGYHTVEMIMQSLDLCDTITVKKRPEGISIQCAQPYVPNDQRNVAWKAAEAFFSEYPHKAGAAITIEKRIPVSAGLAGGSTNAAGVLKALNKLYGSFFDAEGLVRLSKNLGSDVAFCLEGGTQLARGIGNELTRLPDLAGVHIVLIKPSFPVSTPWVYKNLKLSNLGERPDTSKLIGAVTDFDIHALAKGMRNVLESVTVRKYPELQRMMDHLLEYGALGSRMSGSGPTVFGLFETGGQADFATNHLLKNYQYVCHCQTIGKGE
ncbi:MAG TPA: 4-(cytidine 5'-diphospho)-2-C-methyl-D-erythritol kinase [Ruminiclostridium sp.]|jgi:4-diphosphocytidyl-2-C-methyl-D-erythritol kinase|nr:4-(cytidine 5'-diphospho)-2-C-methyl-D-erythritol kinase [Ruminiclostridium sp.]